MQITIITPLYNVENYIAECAESLFRQSYPSIEYVFCNDCTPDGSVEVLQEVMSRFPERQRCVRIVHNDSNKGIGATRARLVSEVRTDYFLFVDSDDVLPLDAVEKLVKRMQQTDADIVEGAYTEYNGGVTVSQHLPSHATGHAYLRKVYCPVDIQLHVWGKLYKTSVLQKVPDLFVEGVDYAEDVSATTRLSAVTTRAWTDDVVYWYRTDNLASYTSNMSPKNILSYCRSVSQIYEFFHQRGPLPLALELGLLNTYRECRRSDIPIQQLDSLLHYVPEHIVSSVLFSLLRSVRVPFRLSDFLYRCVRLLARR